MSGRFEAIRTLSGAEVFDRITGRPADWRPNLAQAEQLARRMNEAVEGRSRRGQDALLGHV